MSPRPNALILRLATEEAESLDYIAKASGLTRSDVLRQLIRKEFAAVSAKRKGKKK